HPSSLQAMVWVRNAGLIEPEHGALSTSKIVSKSLPQVLTVTVPLHEGMKLNHTLLLAEPQADGKTEVAHTVLIENVCPDASAMAFAQESLDGVVVVVKRMSRLPTSPLKPDTKMSCVW